MDESTIKFKEQEIAEELEQWARRHLFLRENQQIRVCVNIEVINTQPVQVTVLVPKKCKPKTIFRYVSTNLSTDDWTKILAIPWSGKSRPYIDELRSTNNTRLRTNIRFSQMTSINLQFTKRGLNYRLRSVKGAMWPHREIRLYIVE